MLWAAASPTETKVNCKKCAKDDDLFCLSKCAVHVVRAKVLWSKKAKASVQILCDLKYPSAEKALASNTTVSASSKTSSPSSKVAGHEKNATSSPTPKSHKRKASWFENLLEGLKGTFGIKKKHHHQKEHHKNATVTAAAKNPSSSWMDDLFSSFDDEKDDQDDESYQDAVEQDDDDDQEWTSSLENEEYFDKEEDTDGVFAALFKKDTKTKSSSQEDIESEIEKEKPKKQHQHHHPFFSAPTLFSRLLQNLGLVKVGQTHGKIVSVFSQTTIGPDGKPVTKREESVRLFKRVGGKNKSKKTRAKVVTIKYGPRSGCKKSLEKGEILYLFLGKERGNSYTIEGSRKSSCLGVVGKGDNHVDAAKTAQNILKTVGKGAVGLSCPAYTHHK